jgi:hypothetical protein
VHAREEDVNPKSRNEGQCDRHNEGITSFLILIASSLFLLLWLHYQLEHNNTSRPLVDKSSKEAASKKRKMKVTATKKLRNNLFLWTSSTRVSFCATKTTTKSHLFTSPFYSSWLDSSNLHTHTWHEGIRITWKIHSSRTNTKFISRSEHLIHFRKRVLGITVTILKDLAKLQTKMGNMFTWNIASESTHLCNINYSWIGRNVDLLRPLLSLPVKLLSLFRTHYSTRIKKSRMVAKR